MIQLSAGDTWIPPRPLKFPGDGVPDEGGGRGTGDTGSPKLSVKKIAEVLQHELEVAQGFTRKPPLKPGTPNKPKSVTEQARTDSAPVSGVDYVHPHGGPDGSGTEFSITFCAEGEVNVGVAGESETQLKVSVDVEADEDEDFKVKILDPEDVRNASKNRGWTETPDGTEHKTVNVNKFKKKPPPRRKEKGDPKPPWPRIPINYDEPSLGGALEPKKKKKKKADDESHRIFINYNESPSFDGSGPTPRGGPIGGCALPSIDGGGTFTARGDALGVGRARVCAPIGGGMPPPQAYAAHGFYYGRHSQSGIVQDDVALVSRRAPRFQSPRSSRQPRTATPIQPWEPLPKPDEMRPIVPTLHVVGQLPPVVPVAPTVQSPSPTPDRTTASGNVLSARTPSTPHAPSGSSPGRSSGSGDAEFKVNPDSSGSPIGPVGPGRGPRQGP